MKAIWHLARKDLRRGLIPGAIFLLLLVTKLLLGIQLLDVVDSHQFGALSDYLKVSLVAELVFGYALVAAIVQEDPLGGSRAFWMTRPISGLQLLTAKLLVLVLVVILLPAVVALPWWLACGLDASAIASAAGRTVLFQTLIVLAGLPFAVVTSNLARYAGCTVAVVASAIIAKMALRAAGWENSVLPPDAAETRSVIVGIVLCATVATLVVQQYLTRRTLRSIAIGATGVFLAFVIAAIWRSDWAAARASGDPAAIASTALGLEIEAADLRTQRQARIGNYMTVRGRLSGFPPDCIAEQFTGRQTWTGPDGTETSLPIAKPATSAGIESIVRKRLGFPPIASPLSALRNFEEVDATGTRLFSFSAPWPAPFLPKVKDQPVAIGLDVQTRLLRPTLLGEVEVAPGASFTAAGHTLRVLRIMDLGNDRTEISILEIAASTRVRAVRSFDVFLIDRSAGLLSGFDENRSEQMSVAGVSVTARTMVLRAGQLPGNAALATPENRGRFRLARIAYDSLGSIRLSARVPKIVVNID